MIVRPIARLLAGITAFACVFACVPHARKDACAGGGMVTGERDGTSVTDASPPGMSFHAKIDDPSYTVAALVPQATGGFAVCPGSGTADGTFTIARAPAGRYLLQLAGEYFVTSQRNLTVNSAFLGRANAVAAMNVPAVTFTLSGLDPWQSDDRLEVYSAESPTTLFDPQASAPPPAGAQDASFVVPWSADAGAFLSDPMKGDRTCITQLVDRGSDPPQRALQRVTSTRVVVRDGTPSTISAVLSPADVSLHFSTTWKRPGFAQVALAGNPVASVYGDILNLYALPGLDLYGPYDVFADLLESRIRDGATSDSKFSSVAYANPFGWPVGYRATNFVVIDVKLPGGGTAQVLARTSTEDFVSNLGAEIVPQAQPVSGLTVAGGDPFTDRDNIGATPDLRWTLPSPAPDEVQVDVEEVTEDAGQTVLHLVARLHVPHDEDSGGVRVPDVLTPGHRYIFVVRAVVEPNVDHLHDPLGEKLPKALAEVVTSSFTP